FSRILMSVIFIGSGFNKLFEPTSSLEYLVSFGLPQNRILLIGTALLEIIGGLALLMGFKERIAAACLAIYLLPVTMIFHTNFADSQQFMHFMKNLAIIGGLLHVAGMPVRQKRQMQTPHEVPASPA